jgi:hypothetical protein
VVMLFADESFKCVAPATAVVTFEVFLGIDVSDSYRLPLVLIAGMGICFVANKPPRLYRLRHVWRKVGTLFKQLY